MDFNLYGEVAATFLGEKPAGGYNVEFSAKGGSASGGSTFALQSRIYFYQLRAGNPSTSLSTSRQGSGQSFLETKRMILLR